ncbi:MAG: metalloregulator ArsR/SmtB family transcription factor [Thermodesulfobacteriota bacterium]|nr:metalloregulator ArsR/SmtB family transcription factor [Thermodesulfobacteriota bacterium]
MKSFIKVTKALSDANRVKMVKLLQRRVLCVCEIQAALGLAQSTASKHLKILEEAGLITCAKEGPWVNYRLADGSANPYAASLLGNLRHWLEEDAEVRDLTKKLPAIHREHICGPKSCTGISPKNESAQQPEQTA